MLEPLEKVGFPFKCLSLNVPYTLHLTQSWSPPDCDLLCTLVVPIFQSSIMLDVLKHHIHTQMIYSFLISTTALRRKHIVLKTGVSTESPHLGQHGEVDTLMALHLDMFRIRNKSNVISRLKFIPLISHSLQVTVRCSTQLHSTSDALMQAVLISSGVNWKHSLRSVRKTDMRRWKCAY